MAEDQFAPFVLSSFEDNYEVLLFDFDNFIELFEEHGYSGNGHSWGSLAAFILKNEDPALLEKVEFDPEGDTFVAIASNKEDQHRLATLLSRISKNKEGLTYYLSEVPPDEMDD
jgi:hypothetical protein